MNPYLRRKIEERAAVGDLISATLERCAAENRDPNPDEKVKLDEWSLRCAALDDDIKQLETRMRADQVFTTTVGRIGQTEEKREQREAAARDTTTAKVETRTAGQQFVASDAFKAYRGRGSMEAIEFGGFLETRAATPITTATLEGIIPVHQWAGPADPGLRTPLLDVIGREVVGSGQVEYIEWSDVTPAGGPIPEGTEKPEATLTARIVPVALETYAHWKAITRQALEDYPRIQSIVDGKLRTGLAKKIEQVASAEVLAAAFDTVVNADPLAGARHAIGVVQDNGFQPNAILLNPSDYAEFDITAAEAAGNGPVQFGTFWGLRAVPVADVPIGTQLVGDFREAITWFDRATAAVYMTDSHADFFVRNLLIILAEQRGAVKATNLAAAVRVSATEPGALAAAKTPAKA